MTIDRRICLAVLGASFTLLSGCRILGGGKSCHDPQLYEQARSIAPLQIPEGLDGPDTRNAMRIPELSAPAPPPPGKDDPCLDAPPQYYSTPIPPSNVTPAPPPRRGDRAPAPASPAPDSPPPARP